MKPPPVPTSVQRFSSPVAEISTGVLSFRQSRNDGCSGDLWSPAAGCGQVRPTVGAAAWLAANVTATTASGGAMQMHSRRPLPAEGGPSQSEATHFEGGRRGQSPLVTFWVLFLHRKSTSPAGETFLTSPSFASQMPPPLIGEARDAPGPYECSHQ